MKENTITDEKRRQAAISRIKKYFGRFFPEMKRVLNIDMLELTEKLSTNMLSRLSMGKGIIIDGDVNLGPGKVENGLWCLSLKRVANHLGESSWNFFLYPVAYNMDGQGIRHPVKTAMSDTEDLILNNILYKSDSDELKGWRLCGMGIKQETQHGQILFTPSPWNEKIGISKTVTYIDQRLRSLLKEELYFRTFDESGKLSSTPSRGFSLKGATESDTENTLEILKSGGQATLTNKEGQQACVRYDCEENNLVATIPLKLALRQERRSNMSQDDRMRKEVVITTSPTLQGDSDKKVKFAR